MNKSNNKISAPLAGFIVAFIGAVLFSTKAIIAKKAFAEIAAAPLTLIAIRMLFSLPFYLAVAFYSGNKKENVKLSRTQWWQIILVGLLGYYVSSFLDFTGLQYVSAGLERLILFLYPTFAILINAYFFKVKISGVQKIALAITYAGIGFAYFGELKVDAANPNLLWGSLLIFICAITYSLYIVGSGRLIPVVGATKFTAYAMLTATAGVLLHFLFAGHIETIHFSTSLLWFGFLLAVMATVIPSFMISYGMKTIGTNNTAIITSVGPVATIIQAHYFLGEKIFTEQLIGTVLVVAGVLLIGWKRNIPPAKE